MAILSGFILNFWDKIITTIITAANKKLATDAVAILLLVKTSAESGWNSPSLNKRNKIAPNEANAPTIIAWPFNYQKTKIDLQFKTNRKKQTCVKAKFPSIALITFFFEFNRPILALWKKFLKN